MTRPQTKNGNKYGMAALKYRRGLLAGEIAKLEEQIRWKKRQIEHLDGSLHLLGQDPGTAPPVKHYKRIALFKQGELSQTVRDVLRRHETPLSPQEVITGVIAATGWNEDHVPALSRRIRAALTYLERTGRAQRTYRCGKAVWTLAT